MDDILVSVVVVTYNFESVILETLESIKNQTYSKIELVITDDNSTDKTIEVCKSWIEKNKERFENIIILENKINSGPTKNYNIGLKAAKGEWIKYISDDIMERDFIEDSINIVKNNHNIEVLFSQCRNFYGDFKDENFGDLYPSDDSKFIYDLSSEEQLKYMMKGSYISAPTNFIKKSLLKEMNYCDERYEFFEDYPLWIKILESKRKLYFNNKVNIYYRRWEKSISYNSNSYLNKKLIEFHRQYFENEEKYKIKSRVKRFEKNLDIYRSEVIIRSGNKKQTLYSKLLRYLQPSRYKKRKYKYILIVIIIFLFFYFIKGGNH